MRFFSFVLIFALIVFVAMAKPKGPPEGILLFYTRFSPMVYAMGKSVNFVHVHLYTVLWARREDARYAHGTGKTCAPLEGVGGGE